jgi:hypothetical protein
MGRGRCDAANPAGNSEAELKRVLGVQRHIEGIDGMDYRTHAIHANLVLHVRHCYN